MAQHEEDLSRLIDGSAGHSGVISTKDEEFGAGSGQERGIPPISSLDKGGKTGETCTIGLTTKQKMLLEDIRQHPTSSITQRYARLRFSSRAGHIVQKELVSKGLVSTFDVILEKGRMRGLALTREGASALGLRVGESYRSGGPVHRYWVERIAEHLQACGYDVKQEVPAGGGKTIDIVAGRDGQKIAFEIETGNSDVRANLNKCLAQKVDRVVFATTSARANAVVRRAVGGYPGAEVLKTTTVVGRAW
jgi:hypothetical protein